MAFGFKYIIGIALIMSTVALTPVISEAYFSKNILHFTNGNQWIATKNASEAAVQFKGQILMLQNGTIIDSPHKTIENYIAPLIGSIMAFALPSTANIPDSWLVCDGSEVKKSDYPLLYAVIQDSWGTTLDPSKFVLPNLNNVLLRGVDNFGSGASGRDVDIPRYQTPTFQTPITNTINVGTYQRNTISSHQHTFSFSAPTTGTVGGEHNHQFTGRFPNILATIFADSPEGEVIGNIGNTTDSTNIVGATYTGGVGPHAHSATLSGADTTFNTASINQDNMGRPKRIHLVYCIKYDPI
jgi:microcystin-dependent protein